MYTLRLLFIIVFASLVQSTPIEIVQQLDSAYNQKLNIIKTFRDFYKRKIYLNLFPYECITAAKDINVKVRTEKQLFSKPVPKDQSAFEDLVILQGQSTLHRTTTFIYQYKHLQYIRQFDDEDTKARNAKKALQNIKMGDYKYPNHKLPKVDVKKYSYLFSHINTYAETAQNLRFQYDHYSNVIRFNKPLMQSKLQKNVQFYIECEQLSQKTKSLQKYGYKGVAISNFEILLHGKSEFKCKTIQKLNEASDNKEKLSLLRTRGKIINGNLNNVCGINEDDPLKVGEVLVLQQQKQVLNPRTNLIMMQKEQHIVGITKMLGEQAFEVSHYFYPQTKVISCFRIAKQDKGIYGKVSTLLEQKMGEEQDKINEYDDTHLIKGQYIGRRIFKFKNYVEEGDRLFCINRFEISNQKLIRTTYLRIGKQFGKGYRQVYFQQNKEDPLRYLTRQEDKQFYSCALQTQYQNKNTQNSFQEQQQIESEKKFTKLSLIYGQKQFKVQDVQIDEVIYALTLSPSAIVQIEANIQPQTSSVDQNGQPIISMPKVNKYILTSKKIYKIQTLQNGTKIQTTQNSFYENSTSQNIIWIHKGMWRIGDFLKFPRVLMHTLQKIVSIKAKFGFAYVRQLDLRILGKDNFVVSSEFLDTHIGYGPKKRPIKAISTQNRFKGGEFCGGTINKYRQTLIKMKCGESWLKIEQVKQTSPCVYELKLTTQFLCPEEQELPTIGNTIIPFNGTLCYPID